MSQLTASNAEEIVERLEQFFKLSPEERKESVMWGSPDQMCSAGVYLYPRFCDDPEQNKAFFAHIDPGGCRMCRSSFLKYVWRVTN